MPDKKNKSNRGNIFKAKCACGSRATLIRSDRSKEHSPDDSAILTAECDNPECKRIFRLILSFFDELAPPLTSFPAPQFLEKGQT